MRRLLQATRHPLGESIMVSWSRTQRSERERRVSTIVPPHSKAHGVPDHSNSQSTVAPIAQPGGERRRATIIASPAVRPISTPERRAARERINRNTKVWRPLALVGTPSGIFDLTATREKLFAVTAHQQIWASDPLCPQSGWMMSGAAQNLVALSADAERLYGIARDGGLWWRAPVASDVNWSYIQASPRLIALAQDGGMLFGIDSDAGLWRRPIGPQAQRWTRIAESPSARAFTAIHGKLFALSRDQCLWWRDTRLTHSSWRLIDRTENKELTALTAIHGQLVALACDNSTWLRDPAPAPATSLR